MKRLVVLLSVLALVHSAAYAKTTPQKFYDIRSMAMGGTGVASGKGIGMLYMNPALLNQSNGNFHILSFRADLSDEASEASDKLTEFADEVNTDVAGESEGQKTDRVMEAMKNLVPTKLKSRVSLGAPLQFITKTPMFLSPVADTIGVGNFMNVQIDARFVDPSFPVVKMQMAADDALVFGFAKRLDTAFWSAPIDLGFGIKYMSQMKSYNPLDGSETVKLGAGNFASEDYDIGYTHGQGIGFDIGAMTAGPGFTEGDRVGLVIRDLATTLEGDRVTDVSNDVKEDFTGRMPTTVTIGYAGSFSLDVPVPVIQGFLTDIDFAVDYDLCSPEVSMFKRFHAGLEKGILSDMVKLRLGNHQGNTTIGVALDLWFFHLAYTNFTDELGRKIGTNRVTYHMVEAGFYF